MTLCPRCGFENYQMTQCGNCGLYLQVPPVGEYPPPPPQQGHPETYYPGSHTTPPSASQEVPQYPPHAPPPPPQALPPRPTGINPLLVIGVVSVVAIIVIAGAFLVLPTTRNNGIDDISEMGERFMAMHTNEDGNIAEGAYISTFRGHQGVFDTTGVINEVYLPNGGALSHTGAYGDLVAIGLHTDFNPPGTDANQEMYHVKTRGGWFNIGDNEIQDLPLVPTPEEERYTAIQGSSIQVSPSGHVFYVTEHKSDYYFTDDQTYYVVRFNPKTGVTDSIDQETQEAFLRAQSETVDRYGNIWSVISHTIYPSDCGRYVYSTIKPNSYYGGTWYGAGPWYLFEYDFETGTFRRLGDELDSKDHTLIGITKDSRYLLYQHDGVRKRLDMENNQITILENAPGGSTQRTSWNNQGFVYVAGGTHEALYYYNMITDEESVKIARQPNIAGAYNYIYKVRPQVSSDGNKLYFVLNPGAWYYGPDGDERIDAEENTLYVMSDFTSDNPQTTVACQLPSNVQGIRIIWDG